MATLVLVGGRDAALEAALRMGHRVVLISDRKPLRRRRAQLVALIEVEWEASSLDAPAWVGEVAEQLQRLPEPVAAVLAATERAVLPAALLRKALNLPGNSPECAQACRDKVVMKERIRAAGLPCADFSLVTDRTTPTGLIRQLGLPLVLKPTDSSGARGAVIAKTQLDVESHFAPGLLAESFVHGLEMSVESVVANNKILFTNITEYLLPLWANVVPATLPAPMRKAVHELNRAAIRALGIRQGMTHLELFLTPVGPIFSELAVRPPGGHLMQLLELAYGFDPWRTVIDVELGAKPVLPESAHTFSGMWLLHPGAGIVKHVHGVRATKAITGVTEVACRVSPGENLSARAGSGESAGHIIVKGATRDEVVGALSAARRALFVELESSAS